jgi:hypothetical protein
MNGIVLIPILMGNVGPLHGWMKWLFIVADFSIAIMIIITVFKNLWK